MCHCTLHGHEPSWKTASLAYVAVRADGFRKRQITAIFGVLLGLGLLLKVTFLVYGAGIVGGVMKIDPPDARQHGLDEPFMPGDIDDS
jgi:hypothetical protein